MTDGEGESDPLLRALKQLADETLDEEVPERLVRILKKPSAGSAPDSPVDIPSATEADGNDDADGK